MQKGTHRPLNHGDRESLQGLPLDPTPGYARFTDCSMTLKYKSEMANWLHYMS